jgi:hypothetical protein
MRRKENLSLIYLLQILIIAQYFGACPNAIILLNHIIEMDHLRNFFLGNTTTHYVEVGFSEREAQAMAWIAEQKPKGKFYGFLVGSFVALSWGHWHDRITVHFGVRFSRLVT